jgi:dihydrofolate synthase/folylpolyglutamate synthase
VITNISRDHTNVLGGSVAQIAAEKAGIVKPGIPLISGVASGPAGDVVQQVCRRQDSPLFRLGSEIEWRPSQNGEHASKRTGFADGHAKIDVETPWGCADNVPVSLLGTHQGANAALAVAAARLLTTRSLEIPLRAIYDGMAAVRWPARIEVVATSPIVVVDAAHNWASTQALVDTLDDHFPDRRRILVFAGTKDKDVSGLLRLLVPRFDTVILTQYHTNPRAVPAEELLALVQATSLRSCHLAPDSAAAWKMARRLAAPDDLVCVTGSFFIATEVRTMLLAQQAG